MTVSIPRSNGTQTRTFQWTGSDLTSATNPENGTVTYQYNGAHQVTQRIDAKGQKTTYEYDDYGRLTITRHYLLVNGSYQEQTNQTVNYYYDTNPLDSSYSQNAWGRLTAVTFGGISNFYNGSYGSGVDGTDYYMTLTPAYLFNYNQAGRVTGKRLRILQDYTNWTATVTNNLDATYAWDDRSRMTSETYPGGGQSFTYQYDSMGRLQSNGVATATYNGIGQMTQLAWDGLTETRTYNTLMQLTRMTTVGGGQTMMDMQYVYPTANNGRISRTIDGVAGETVDYTYDVLNRLATAAAQGGWGQQYVYDGFGNIQGMQGAAVWSYDPATNRRTDTSYDANGLSTGWTWDVENRAVYRHYIDSTYRDDFYAYDPYGKRILAVIGSGYHIPPQTPKAYFYSITGQKVATIQCTGQTIPEPGAPPSCTVASTNVYFGGKLIRSNGVAVATDRLGSVRANTNGERMRYMPYGQEITSTADGREKFGTYFRDGSGQDYADQRYYDQMGRFWSPDPGGIATADPANPTSWNRYAYVNGDPPNLYDPQGLNAMSPENPSYCPPEYSFNECTNLGIIRNGGAGGEGGGGGGGAAASMLWVQSDLYAYLQSLGLSFLPGAIALPIGEGMGTLVCMGSGACEVIAIGAGAAGAIWGTWELGNWLNRKLRGPTARDLAPPQARAMTAYQSPTDDNGDCEPPDPTKNVKWRGTDDSHWHWIEWNQDKDCVNHPRFRTGPDPGPGYVEIPR